ncbi:unnamed protein product, partial [Meganyctiphanes norvegica]
VRRDTDSGDYTCTASNKHGHESSQTLNLQVLVPPAIRPFDFGKLRAQMRTTVTCDVQDGDPPIRLSWLSNGRPLSPGDPELQVVQHGDFSSILTIPVVLPRHSGNYTCLAVNAAREARFTASLVVQGNVQSSWIQFRHRTCSSMHHM